MPAELRDVHGGGRTIDGAYHTRWREHPIPHRDADTDFGLNGTKISYTDESSSP
jgi:hypothetical protein